MSFFDDVGLRAAEQLESSVGPFIALASYKRLYAGPSDIHAKAVMGALRCSIALADDREIDRAVDAYRQLATPRPSALRHATDLLVMGKADLAAKLAALDEDRPRSARVRYVRARAAEASLSQAGDPREAWREVVTGALAAGDDVIHACATARWLGLWLAHARRDATAVLPRADIAHHCEKARLDEAQPEQKLLILRGRLLSGSNFQRASALSALEELARRGSAEVRARALAIVCRHFDEMPFHLHAIEVDRVRAALKRMEDSPARETLSRRFESTVTIMTAFARRTDDGGAKLAAAASGLASTSAPAAKGGPFTRATAASVEAIMATKDGRASDAARSIDAASALLSPDIPVPLPTWAAASLGLESTSEELRGSAARLVQAAFSRTTSLPPPPLVGLAGQLARNGANDVAAMVLEEAARFREPAARLAAADNARRAGYRALARGERATAFEELRKAKELAALVGSSASQPARP
ncbi:MAG: hypothetical protein HOW73_00190 [Polyangiaceae bacterium]|nr:hypothetical protein [Polyangiaceae bacterium]